MQVCVYFCSYVTMIETNKTGKVILQWSNCKDLYLTRQKNFKLIKFCLEETFTGYTYRYKVHERK